MNGRSMAAVLDEIVGQRGRHAKLGRRLRVNQERNWLLAVILNTYSKVAAGAPTNDLDNIITAAFEAEGLDKRMREHGELYAALSPSVRAELFPGSFATFPEHADYTLADLVRDLPGRDAAVRAMPNATDIDVAAVHAGTLERRDIRRPGRAVALEHGGELLRAVEDDDPRSARLFADGYSIRVTELHCNDETGFDFLGSDEPYVIGGTTAGGISVTRRSPVFEDVDSGDTVTFAPGDLVLWGFSGGPEDLPAGEIGVLIRFWEHDSSNPDEIKATVAAAFAAAAGILTATGVAAWVGGVVAAVGAAVTWLVSFLDDDHIADQTFVFSRQAIIDQIGKVGASFDVTRQFTDGDGDYTLTLRVTHVGPPPPQVSVPDVRGEFRAQAVADVLAAHLVPRATGLPNPDATVHTQSPNPGARVNQGSVVNLFLRVEPEQP